MNIGSEHITLAFQALIAIIGFFIVRTLNRIEKKIDAHDAEISSLKAHAETSKAICDERHA